ncbi:MAG: DinB family protein [Bacteroidota bacterium]
MKRNRFLRNVLGVGIFSLMGCQTDQSHGQVAAIGGEEKNPQGTPSTQALRQELAAAWTRSETMTLKNVDQMRPEAFTFRYTEEAMTFTEQWRHCVMYTCSQLSGRAGVANPYEGVKLPVQMPKEQIMGELKNMYAFVQQTIQALSDETLLSTCDFAGDTIPIWRLLYALENHIIHHRGQCVVYLRLSGVVPKGFYGW